MRSARESFHSIFRTLNGHGVLGPNQLLNIDLEIENGEVNGMFSEFFSYIRCEFNSNVIIKSHRLPKVPAQLRCNQCCKAFMRN